MLSEEKTVPSFDFEKEVERTKWFKEDLDKGGWKKTDTYFCDSMPGKVPVSLVSISKCLASLIPGSTYWIKTFPGEVVPVKLFFKWNMPMPAKMFMEMLHPSTLEVRKKWDTVFIDLEKLEEYPDGGFVIFQRTVEPWPLTDRGFVLFSSPVKEIDWYGKQAYVMFLRNASHPSKPEGVDGLVRAYNGGSFYVAIPDESEPEMACEVLGLSNNLFNSWLPDIECLIAKLVPRGLDKLRENIIKGYREYYA